MGEFLKKIVPAGLVGLVLASVSMLSGATGAAAAQETPSATIPPAIQATSAKDTLFGYRSQLIVPEFAPEAPTPAATQDAGAKRLPLDPTDPVIQNEKMPADQGLLPSAKQFAVPEVAGSFKFTAPAPGGQSTGAVPAGLSDFYAQKVNWGSCAGFSTSQTMDIIQGIIDSGPAGLARIETAYGAPGLAKDWAGMNFSCAYVAVPVDYTKPNGPTAAIAVAKASTGLGSNGKPKHALFGNAGGPGQPSLPFSVQWAAQYRSSLTDYDIIAPDTRGAGASLPQIRCATNKFLQAQSEGVDGLASTPEGLAKLDQINKANTEACYTNTGLGFLNPDGTAFSSESYLPKVSVDDEARDMDVIRSILGNEKLSYQGGSDGTGVGYTYAQEFPESTRAMILDSPENPFENNPAEAAKFQDITGTPKADPYSQSKGFQDTFYQFAAKCATDNGFDYAGAKVPCALGTDADRTKLIAAYQAISQKAFGATTYFSDSLNRPLSFKDFTQATTGALYGSRNWAKLNAGLAAAKDGKDVKDLLGLSDSYYSWDGKSNYPFFVVATFPTIACQNFTADATDITAKGEYAAAPFKNPGNDPVSGVQRDGLDSKFGWCDFYHTKNQKAKAQSVKALPNILVVASSHDPATPYVGGVVMAKGLGATLLTVENPQHIALGQGIDCADAIADAYLKTLTVPTNIPGKTGMQVLDLSQRPIDPTTNTNIVGDECRVDPGNRSVPAIAAANALVGATEPVQITVSGLVRGAAYKFDLAKADGTEVGTDAASKQYQADANGDLSIPLTLPASATAGQYSLKLGGTEDVNAKIAVAPGTLTLTKAPVDLKVAKSTLVAGADQTITGTGFEANAKLALVLHSTPVDLGGVTTDAKGAFSKTFTVPADFEAGAHKVLVTAADGTAFEAAFQVTAKSVEPVIVPTGNGGVAAGNNPAAGGVDAAATNGDLANTGANGLLTFGGIGAGVLLLGAVVLLTVRRRRNVAPSES
ncbi:putative peptidase [Renibacterium salmoninarum ATCC 33209]|uniref:Peptidase S33 tripeptidyl aminopeptidase-like C-terminal domain-containing protein n=2 Tax=Renibacterium salmoninarum TaxID=1646 RepID=A5HB60_RENSA|nr:putative proteinase [Renibacterium salmoninarum]ABY23837.1 putative peptidase [Renibacterium salmoninarum ATCC 33209]